MKILIKEKEIEIIEDVLYDLIHLAKKGPKWISCFFDTPNDSLPLKKAYSLVINKYITGFISEEFETQNLVNKEFLLELIDIRFAMIWYENDYERIKREFNKEEYIDIYSKVKIIKEDKEYYLDIKDDLISILKFSFDSYLGILNKNKKKFIDFFSLFYRFNIKQECFKEYLDLLFFYLGKAKRKQEKEKNIKEILRKLEVHEYDLYNR